MNTQFEFISADSSRKHGDLIRKRRVMIGRSNACDIVVDYPEITGIHAVIEVSTGVARIYDMNSTNGTFVNGHKVVSQDLKIGDCIRLGNREFLFKEFNQNDLPPAPLEMLAPIIQSRPEKKMAELPPSLKSESRVKYPLAKDPKALYSSYIFEDADSLYPIFHYDMANRAIEIIITFKDKILTIDYLPDKDGIYFLQGRSENSRIVEFPYLNIDEKVSFVEVVNRDVFVHSLPGFDVISLVDEEKEVKGIRAFIIKQDDIVCFMKGDVKIYVRGSEAPPVVDRAPIFRRDQDFKKYLLLVFFLIFAFLGGMSLIPVDEEVKKEKAPERIARILYKPKKLTVSKSQTIDKTPEAPKIEQKSPTEKKITETTQTSNEKKEADKKPSVTEKVGKSNTIVKQATPNKGEKDNLKTNKVAPTTPSKSPAPAQKSVAKSSNRRADSKSKGNVDAYKSLDFNSTISSLMAKGGGAATADVAETSAVDGSGSGVVGGESATLKKATVSTNVGSLAGAAEGKLEAGEGLEGVVGKKSIYTAGLPFKTVILGGIDPDVIRRILMDHIPQFRFCYQKELDRQEQKYHGIVRLNFVIGASGHVTKADVESASGSLPTPVRSCVVSVLRGIKFPEPMGGGVAEVRQPINFYPK